MSIITVKGEYIFPNQIKMDNGEIIICVFNSYIKDEELKGKECFFQLEEAGWCYEVLQVVEV